MKLKSKHVLLTLLAAVGVGLVIAAVQWFYGDTAALRVAAVLGLGCGLTALATLCSRSVVSIVLIAAFLFATQPAQARRYADGVPYQMTVGEVIAGANAVGATVIWLDGTQPDRRCGPCLLAIAVVIIIGALWYASCQAKKRERQLPPE